MHLRFGLSVASLLALAPVASAEPVTLKLSHFLGPTSFFQLDFAEPWGRELEARSNGQVKVEIFNGASPQGKVTEQANQVKAGTVDIALGLRGAEGDKFLRSSIIELPFVVPSAAKGSMVLWDMMQAGAFGDEYADYKVLALFVHNPGLIHTTNKRVVAPEDIKSVRLRVPNGTVAAALTHLGAAPAVLQVNDVMPAVKEGRIDGIVTNWGNPLPNFNDFMKYHTDIQFYTSAFFVVMNKEKYASLPPEAKSAIDALSGEALVTRFGTLWNKWDGPVREGAKGPGHEVIVPDAPALAKWHTALQPVTDGYIADLAKRGFTDGKAAYAKMVDMVAR